jgi:nicotinamide riboside transporter PnuC
MIPLIEWLAAVAAVAGTLLLARKGPRAGWGFVLYLVSNAGWIASALHHGAWALLAQQAIFVATSCCGVWTWLVQPLLQSLEIDA